MNTAEQDFQGRSLVVGDRVAATLNGYSPLIALVVVGFTDKKIRLIRDPEVYGTDIYKEGKTYLKFPEEVTLIR